MKILAFVDLHTSKKALKILKKKALKADVVVCAGDFSIFGNGQQQMIKAFDSWGKPVLLVHGNHEDIKTTRQLCAKTKHVSFIHAKKISFNGVTFIGWGGGGFSRIDPGLEKFMKRLKIDKKDKIVFVTHAPPFKTAIDNIYGESAGNKTIRKFIERVKPIVAIAGHLHENMGKIDKIKKSLVINPGSDGRILEI